MPLPWTAGFEYEPSPEDTRDQIHPCTGTGTTGLCLPDSGAALNFNVSIGYCKGTESLEHRPTTDMPLSATASPSSAQSQHIPVPAQNGPCILAVL